MCFVFWLATPIACGSGSDDRKMDVERDAGASSHRLVPRTCMRGSDPHPFGAGGRVSVLFHRKIVHMPERGAAEDIRDACHALTLQHLGGLHTTMATLADHQDIAVGRHLIGSMP